MTPISRLASLALLLVLFFAFSLHAQSPLGWETLVSDKGELSVQVPSSYISHKEETDISVYYRGDGVSGSVRQQTVDAKRFLSSIRSRGEDDDNDDDPQYQEFKFEGFSLIRYSSDAKWPAYTETIYMAAGGRFFTISAHGKDRNDPNVRRVMDSIRIKGRLLTPGAAAVEDAPQLTELKKLKTSPEVRQALKRPGTLLKKARFENFDKTRVPDIRSTVYTRQLIVLKKYKAAYTDKARSENVRGTVKGRILFKADGTIGEIAMDPTLDKGLAISAADAARRIIFLPAEIDGKPVDEWRSISYSFDIY